MHSPFSVWAPRAHTLSITIDGHEYPMHPAEGAWWTAEVAPQTGMRYGFTINGTGPVADPRATSLPDGPHGLARIDSQDFEWSDHNWTGRSLAG